ncbi:hypothetical protein BMF38_15590 [Comamonas kerstersii]|nr:hypothetical protein BMF38_15590 [Comamonas kerstersii]
MQLRFAIGLAFQRLPKSFYIRLPLKASVIKQIAMLSLLSERLQINAQNEQLITKNFLTSSSI